MENTVTIDEYTFSLESEIVPYSRRLVKIKSTKIAAPNKDDEQIFVCYSSNSELGMWRYAVIRSDGGLDKGEIHYVSETFIHIELQKYIRNFCCLRSRY